jgi:CMP-N,N'-diacetyllegionaminic acid synthase
MTSILGIITARGDSKGIPRKNLISLLGKPLIYYTIHAAQQSKRLTRTVLSSEDREIISLAKQFGIDVPFTRPLHLAGDEISSVAVVSHAVKFIEAMEKKTYDYISLLQPTAPLRTDYDIDTAIELLENSDADSVVSVTRVEEPHPMKMMIVNDGFLRPFTPDHWHERLRRQELDPVYRLNGAVYCVRTQVLLEQNSLWGKTTLAYIMPPERSINIDNQIDLMLAELILRNN